MAKKMLPNDYPTDWKDLRARPTEKAREGLPTKYKEINRVDGQLQKRKLQSLKRAEAQKNSDVGNSEGHCPPWSDVAFRPKRAALSTPVRVERQGVALNPLGIVHPDNRAAYNDTSYPWGCVCKVITANGSQGSGVLVGPRHVLTASHVIDWSTDRAELVEVHRQGTSLSASSFDTNVMAFTQIGSTTYNTVDEDYAVMILADRLGDRFGWLGTRTYNSDWDEEGLWVTIGYPGDGRFAGLVPTFQNGVYLDEDALDYGGGRAMTTNADLAHGQSGAPFFAWWDGVPYVVAVVSAEGTIPILGTDNWASGGNDLTRLVNQARRDFP